MDDQEDPLLTAKVRADAALQEIDGVLRQTRQLTQSEEDAKAVADLLPPQASPTSDADPPKR